GNRQVPRAGETYSANRAVSHWKALAVKVTNDARDYSIDWAWTPAKGYPDQFRRDRVVVLDVSYSSDCGYSSWTQLPDGRIVIVDFTNGGSLQSFNSGGPAIIVRAYHVREADLVRPRS